MDPSERIEHALRGCTRACEAPGAPPQLAAAIRHAVFPGGARIRPQLCLAVALACGDDDPTLSRRRGRRRSSCCTAPRWSTTTCPASTMRRPGAASRRCTRAFGERARGARRRRADRAGVPDARGRARSFAAASGARCSAPSRRGVGMPLRHRRRPGLGVRGPGRCCATTSAPRPARCSPPRRWPARQPPARTRALAHARRKARRGLPGGRRHPRRDLPTRPSSASRSAATWRSGGPSVARAHGLRRRDRPLRRPGRAAPSRPMPACRGAAALRTLMRAEAERLVPRARCAELGWIAA